MWAAILRGVATEPSLSPRPRPGPPHDGVEELGRGGPGRFTTYEVYRRPDGVLARWESRSRRKQSCRPEHGTGGTWWAPRARGWWMGILFGVGSVLFALAAVPGYARAVGGRTDSLTFFVGSVFFTTAGFLQYRESVDAGRSGPARGWARVFTYRPRQIDWWASGIQLFGTVFFNVSTANAVRVDLTAQAAHQHVWRPDALGSVCFLVASAMAWFEVCHGWVAWSPRSLSWWITLLNLTGSVAFGASAVGAYVEPSNGELRNVGLANLGTFAGAVCFLAGAVLLLPERTTAGDSG